jgi:hypothetical protein
VVGYVQVCLDKFIHVAVRLQSGPVPSSMWTLLILCWCILHANAATLSMREVDGLVFTEEEVNLDRLEKHVFVWKIGFGRRTRRKFPSRGDASRVPYA